ncbi:MAG: hypothetical protein JO102_06840 [Elusimicrobia bacterium]|nr:hypothetical protein [Elusimicrobiota bacterium]
MKFQSSIVAALILLSPLAASADPLNDPFANRQPTNSSPKTSSASAKKASNDMPDSKIDEMKKDLEKVQNRRNDEAGKEASAAQNLEAQFRQDRLAFEKKQIADRKALLESLKKEPDQKKRVASLSKFDSDATRERKKFFLDQMNKRWELNQSFQKERMLTFEEVAASAPAVAAAESKADKKAKTASKPAPHTAPAKTAQTKTAAVTKTTAKK